MIQLRSLQQRTFLSIILPTFIILFSLSAAGFLLLRGVLLEQWGEIAVARLQQKAFELDTELRKPRHLFSLLHQNEDSQVNIRFFKRIISQIEELESVVLVNVGWPDFPKLEELKIPLENVGTGVPKSRSGAGFVVQVPHFTKNIKDRTISMVSELKNSQTNSTGFVEIIFSFDILIQQLLELEWWKIHKAYLIDEEGIVLASTGEQIDLEDYFPMRAFGTISDLEKDTLQALENNRSGTVFGPGLPPEWVSGYYHLEEAPWTIVVVADGKLILRPILRFRYIYVISLAITIILILLFIRGSMGRVISRIRLISAAAESLAGGAFGEPLVDKSKDEVGELTASFNKMTHQLKQRIAMKEAIGLARDVQQNLLPQSSFAVKGITVEGVSLYCDETGGDYYDILDISEDGSRVAVMVGDVVGHGISAALLMSSVRALLRCRFELPGSLSEIIGDVNRLLYKDTNVSGSFITLFVLEIDLNLGTMHWIRAGHEPAFICSGNDKTVSIIKGKGLALGVDPEWEFEANQLLLNGEEQTILLGSDGAWEVKNLKGEQFGKTRIENMLLSYNTLSAGEMVKKITSEISSFKGEVKQDDDITLVVVKLHGKK